MIERVASDFHRKYTTASPGVPPVTTVRPVVNGVPKANVPMKAAGTATEAMGVPVALKAS